VLWSKTVYSPSPVIFGLHQGIFSQCYWM